MISITSLFALGLMGLLFDKHPEYHRSWLNKVGGMLVLAALVFGVMKKFVPHGAVSLTGGLILFAIGSKLSHKQVLR